MCHKFHPAKKAAVLAVFWTVLALPALAAVTVTKTVDLSFGSLVPGAAPGTVTMNSLNGLRTSSGVILFTQGAGATGSLAAFSVTGGVASAACSITLPADASIYLAGSGAPMAVNTFTSTPASQITLDASGGGTIDVGGTLSVGGAQVAGPYTSSFSVTVTCP